MLDVFNEQFRWDSWWEAQIAFLALPHEQDLFTSNMTIWKLSQEISQ